MAMTAKVPKVKLTGLGGPPTGVVKASTKPQSSDSGNKFIKSAIKHPGSLHRALGVPQSQTIPTAKIEAAAKSSDPNLAKKARFAMTLAKIGK